MDKIFGLFKKSGVFGKEELIQLYSDENYAFSQMHSRNLSNFHESPSTHYIIRELIIDTTKNQTVLCPKRRDCLI